MAPGTAARIEVRLQTVHAPGRTAETLLAIALDVLEPYASEYLSRGDYERLRDLVTGPVTAATEAAQAALVRELSRVLLEADPILVGGLKGLRVGAESRLSSG